MGEKNDIKSINEDIARRFSSIADKLKQASNIVDLLEMLLDEVENKFHVPLSGLVLSKTKKMLL